LNCRRRGWPDDAGDDEVADRWEAKSAFAFFMRDDQRFGQGVEVVRPALVVGAVGAGDDDRAAFV
jgi:hypothetical protein